MTDPGSSDTVDLGVPELENATVIGRGGFGVVYRCDQPAFGRTVAVKVLRGTTDDKTARRRFQRELLAMGALSGHPNIVTVYDAGFLPDGDPYLVMDLMTGGSLAEALERGPMPWRDVLRAAVLLCGAVQSAHSLGVLHRDIKPENVMLSEYGAAELSDFGIARLHSGPQTRTEGLTASIPHVAPELLGGQPASPQSDIYALGSTMFQLLTGQYAFVRPTDESLLPAMARIAAEPVPSLAPWGVPPQLEDVVRQMMAKDPAHRPATAAAVGAQLQQLQAAFGLPVTDMAVKTVPAHQRADAGETSVGLPLHTPPPPPTDESAHRPGTEPVPATVTAPTPPAPGRSPALLVGGGLAALAVVALVAVLLMPRGGDEPGEVAGSPAADLSPAAQNPSPADQATAPAQASPSPRPAESRVSPELLTPAGVTASGTAPPGVDASGAAVTYDAANMIDGLLDTTWRVPGNGQGEVVTIAFGRQVRITSVGLVPGYAKVDPFDGTDRFQQNRRVRRVRYVFDATAVEARFAEVPQLEFVDVDTVTSTLRIEILATTRQPERNFTPISEVEVLGVEAG